MPRRTSTRHLPDVVRGTEAVNADILTSRELRNGSVVRLFRDVYRPVWVPLTHELRCEAAGLVMPSEARLTGRSLATVLGVPLASSTDDVEVCVLDDHRFGPVRGLSIRRVCRGPLPGRPWRTTHAAHPFRMAFDLAARREPAWATAYLDAVSAAGLVDLDGFSRWLEDRHDDDVVAVRKAADLTDARAGSPPESVMRVVLRQAGFDVVPQHEVRHGGTFVARVDLALPELRIAIEYDGAWHALREQLEKDRRRLNALRAAGWVVVHVTASVLADRTELVGEVTRAVAARQLPVH